MLLAWRLILGVIVSLSFLLGAVLYIWTKEEVDKGYRYLAWLNLGIFGVGFVVFSLLFEPVYLILLAGALLLSWFLTQKSKFGRRIGKNVAFSASAFGTTGSIKGLLQAGILGAAFAFGVQLASFEAISLFLVAYSLVLASYICKNSKDFKIAFKRADKLVLIFLVVFLALSFIPISEAIAKHTFFWAIAVLAPFTLWKALKI